MKTSWKTELKVLKCNIIYARFSSLSRPHISSLISNGSSKKLLSKVGSKQQHHLRSSEWKIRNKKKMGNKSWICCCYLLPFCFSLTNFFLFFFKDLNGVRRLCLQAKIKWCKLKNEKSGKCQSISIPKSSRLNELICEPLHQHVSLNFHIYRIVSRENHYRK